MWSKIRLVVQSLVLNLWHRPEIVFISEPAQWVISEICGDLVSFLNTTYHRRVAGISYTPFGIRHSLIHFGSISALIIGNTIRTVHPSNSIVVSWYHVLDNDPRVSLIPELNRCVARVHTACIITRDKLISAGFDAHKVVVIPEHIDTAVFRSYTAIEKKEIRDRLGIAEGAFVVGSFQKDGCGWGDGYEPKYEKGPDIFCDTVERVAQNAAIHVLLTGPARGYVKRRLTQAGIPFTHVYVPHISDMVQYYNVLDVYIVSSREEGGPKALLESWACGVPLISTRVGMAPDIIVSGRTGLLVDKEDVNGLVVAVRTIMNDPQKAYAMVDEARKDVVSFTLERIGVRYIQECYISLWPKR